jgi:hypothetical protein
MLVLNPMDIATNHLSFSAQIIASFYPLGLKLTSYGFSLEGAYLTKLFAAITSKE